MCNQRGRYGRNNHQRTSGLEGSKLLPVTRSSCTEPMASGGRQPGDVSAPHAWAITLHQLNLDLL